MIPLTAALATLRFELRRAFSIQRAAVTVVLALFPPTMLLLLSIGSTIANHGQPSARLAEFSTFISVFLVALVLLLSLLLWATPNVHSELEGKSWVFVASRPDARVAMFLGKLFASILVSFSISLVATTLCIAIQKYMLNYTGANQNPIIVWLSMNFVFLLGAVVYSTLFSTIGTIFNKRSMLVAAAFLIGDFILGLMPNAIVNKLTFRQHLQEIGVYYMGWFFPAFFGPESEYRQIFGEAWPIWMHVGFVVLVALALTRLGMYVIVNREFAVDDGT